MHETPKKGDHIYRVGSIRLVDYSHHGIVVKPNQVIHFFKGRDQKHTIKLTSLDEFLEGKPATVKLYSRIVEEIEELSGERLSNSVANNIRANVTDVEGTIRRAEELLGAGGYGLATNNCEHMAVYCKTGYYFSHQMAIRANIWGQLFPNKGHIGQL